MYRSPLVLISLLALLSINCARAQEAGDPVTYTTGGLIYTAILDPELDTVSPILVGTAGVAGVGGVVPVATTTAVVAHGGGGVGGGAGVATTSLASLQVISGYTPPIPSDLPEPVVSSGSIAPLSAIPGYTALVDQQQSGGNGGNTIGSSGSLSLLQGATGFSALVTLMGVVVGAGAVLL